MKTAVNRFTKNKVLGLGLTIVLSPLILHAATPPDYTAKSNQTSYIPIPPTPGNIAALNEQNQDTQSLIKRQGITPEQLQTIIVQPVHPVTINSNDAWQNTVRPDYVPLSQTAPVAPASIPADLSGVISPSLEAQYFAGYTSLGGGADGKVLGLTTMDNNGVSYQLDNSLQNVDSAIGSSLTPVLTFKVQVQSDADQTKADSILGQLEASANSAIPSTLPLTVTLLMLGAAGVAALKLRGLKGSFQITMEPGAPSISKAGVATHEMQHVLDDLGISQDTSAIQESYLDPSSPYNALVEPLMEVRAEIRRLTSANDGSNYTTYLSTNLSKVMSALAGLSPLLQARAPALVAMAQQDIAYATSWLDENRLEDVNLPTASLS